MVVIVALLVLMLTPVARANADPVQAAQSPRGVGARVVATITTHLPGQSVESVEVLANPFAGEYRRFSTSVVPNSSSRR